MAGHTRKPDVIARLRLTLLEWYDRNRRDLPWRRTRDPYAIWVSEIMLQQTRVAAVLERYASFLQRFPTLVALAQAKEQDVLAEWSGLGYYRRARMLHKAAQFVVDQLGGVVPQSSGELRKLPGIGAYTAAAIASIAHGEHVAVVDGNVDRVLCRLQGWEAANSGEESALRPKVQALAAQLIDRSRPGDFNQALMELGAVVCTPRSPQCLTCPWIGNCETRGEHRTPARARMTSREVSCALAVRSLAKGGKAGRQILLEQRPESSSVMPGMWQLPFLRDVAVPEKELCIIVRHAIMHVNYVVHVRIVAADEVGSLDVAGGERRWASVKEAESMALTGLARKVLARAGVCCVRVLSNSPRNSGNSHNGCTPACICGR